MVSWYDDGAISGYDAVMATRQMDRYVLASSGLVDVNGITRMQFNTRTQGGSFDDRLYGIARLNYNPGDVSDANAAGRWLTATMFLVEASAVDGIPTPSEIIAASGVKVYRSATLTRSNGQTLFAINGPNPSALNPNTKHWVVLVPTSVVSGSAASTTNDQPVGAVDTLGRGISLWTNRPPAKPVITSPSSGSSVGAGTDVTFTYTVTDPDAVVGSATPQYTDISGVEVEYSARPTPENPNPEWLPLQIADAFGTLEDGWYIRNMSPVHEGAESLWVDQTMTLDCGQISAGAGYIPSGNWRIRMRVFDHGHPYPNDLNPGNVATGALVPEILSALGSASPWSDAINLYVAAPCPPPIPLSPVKNIAVPEGTPVTLSWQFRSTFTPPRAQQSRTVQIREVGAPTWTTIASGDDTGQTWPVDPYFTLVGGRQYEWRVQVSDNGAPPELSDYSEVARFWMVAAPGSGEVRPLPTQTTDGATLGCGTHRAFIFRRGGTERVGEITSIERLEWNRTRDDISNAEVTVRDWGPDCGALLASLQTWAYELVIFRDNGYSVERVWEGPITRLTYKTDEVTISARDVMVYAYRRIIKERMSDSGNGATVVDRATRVLQNSLASDDPNILAHLTPLSPSNSAMQYRTTPAYSRTAFEEIDDMAANAGLDYVAVGRAILLWGTRNRIGTLPEFRDEDLGAAPIVSEYGMSMSNVYAVSDGNGIFGVADKLGGATTDPIYGRVEMLSSTWASDAPVDTGTYTQEGIATIIESFTESAERSIEDRYPPPVVVRVPDNTSLNPSAVVSIQHLVPGVVIPLRSSGTLRTVRANQKLDSVKVIEEGGKETITITMSPFNRDDSEMVEEE